MTAMPKRLGPPIVFEDDFIFDKKVLLPKLEEYANSVEMFKKVSSGETYTTLEVNNAGTTAFSSENCPHTWPELAKFTEYVLKEARGILKQWNFDFDDVIVLRSWTNRHGNGGWTNYHTHNFTDLVVAAYVQAPPNSGDLLLIDPLENHWFGMPINEKIFHASGYSFPARPNKVYFFAPFIRHGTQPSNSDEYRWVISLNLKCVKKGGIYVPK